MTIKTKPAPKPMHYGSLRLLMLAAVANGASSGASVMKWVGERTHGAYVPGGGSVYPRLSSLELQGLVVRHAGSNGGRASYTITDKGLALSRDKQSEVTKIIRDLRRTSST